MRILAIGDLHGNHALHRRLPDLVPLHGRAIGLDGYEFAGYQYTLPFMGGVNERAGEVMAADLEALAVRMNERTSGGKHLRAMVIDLETLDHLVIDDAPTRAPL